MARLDKHIANMKKNEQNYVSRKASLIQDAKECGVDIKKYWVDGSFDWESLFSDETVFRSGDIQSLPIPFSDKMFETFISMPKQRIGNPIMLNNKQKIVHGTYLLGKHNGHNVVYALSIVRNSKDRFKYMDFSIKLDMLVSGMEWLPLVRFDSIGAGHPNYISGGKVADPEKVKDITGPHIHKNSEATQVLTDDLSYMLATEASQNLKGKFAMSDPYFFRSALESTMRMCGMSTSMLRDHDKSDQYLFGFSNYLFDYDGMEM